MGDIRELMRRDIQMLCENLTVAGCLVEHIDIIGVFKDIFHFTGGEEVFDVLRNLFVIIMQFFICISGALAHFHQCVYSHSA